MANITINEISQNYTYNIGRSSYATVALPIMATWGPGFEYDASSQINLDSEDLENAVWTRFSANQAGLESFVQTYRGPSAQYLKRKDFSYQTAMTLLTAGYDVLICRVAGGQRASGEFLFSTNSETAKTESSSSLNFSAKYSGAFGNSLQAILRKIKKTSYTYWNLVVYILDASGTRTAVENLNFVFDLERSTDSIPHISEVESNFLSFSHITAPTADTVEIFQGSEEHPLPQNIIYDSINNIVASKLAGGTDHPEISSESERIAMEEAAAAQSAAETAKTAAQTAVDTLTAQISSKDTAIAEQQAIVDDPNASTEEKEAAQAQIDSLTEEKSELETQLTTAQNNLTDAIETLEEATAAFEAAKEAYENQSGRYLSRAYECAASRYTHAHINQAFDPTDEDQLTYLNGIFYMKTLEELKSDTSSVDVNTAINICRREWTFNAAYGVLGALTDRLAYNPNRVIVPGWDDQDISYLTEDAYPNIQSFVVSPLHQRLMEVAYYSRCSLAYVDIPRSLRKADVYRDVEDYHLSGYAQKLARLADQMSNLIANGTIYASHAALFAPWGKYTFVGTGKQAIASPSFLALMIDRAMIKNQTSQYEWELPTNRRHNLKIGRMDYNISKKYLDAWQSLEGVGVNCITQIPDLGLSIWGNSTLYEVPPATYQALANLSTRKLVNAIEDLAYRCGISITFQYNNDQAYNAFYAGMTPLLDTMRNVGAIEDYYLRMAEDINGLDNVNANSVIGKIYLVIDGVINDINIDLIALPPTTSLDEYRA